jgi:hypothetical protein
LLFEPTRGFCIDPTFFALVVAIIVIKLRIHADEGLQVWNRFDKNTFATAAPMVFKERIVKAGEIREKRRSPQRWSADNVLIVLMSFNQYLGMI